MTVIANNINTYADLTAYNNDVAKDYPNVSYIQATDEVKMYEYDPKYVVCKYNVTSTESATTLLYNSDGLNKMYIDGVQQQSVVRSYTFQTTGEHIVKYGLTNTTIFSYGGNQLNSVTALIEVSIPDTVTTMGNTVFMNCGNLKKVKLSNKLTKIGNNVFNDCISMTSFNIPSGITSIGNYCFMQSGLTSVIISNTVTSIGSSCFRFSSNLSSVTVLATTPPTLGDSTVFANTKNNMKIYVPAAYVDTYKAASGWSDYASQIEAIPSV